MGKDTTLRGIGLTPVLMRTAHYYTKLGLGEYPVPGHSRYDKVVVRDLYAFKENPLTPGEYAGGLVVEFFLGERKVRYVEFRCQVVGGGGAPVARPV